MATNAPKAAAISDPSPRRPSPQQLWVALAHSYRALSTAIERSFLDSGLGLTDFTLLEALLHKGPLTITAIQASVLLATGSMTAAVDRLEKRALIARKSIEGDRRARLLELTPEGRILIASVYRQHKQNLLQWLGVLSAGERSTAYQLLRKLERHVQSTSSIK